MDINTASVYKNISKEKQNSIFHNEPSFQKIGKKGQVVQGTITQVSNQLTINFNGINVNVASNAVKNPKEGETRNFQIKDISEEGIVLKEVNTSQTSTEKNGMIKTTVAAGNYSFSDAMKDAKNTAQAKIDSSQDLSILNGEDYEDIEQEEGSVSKVTQESLSRAVERMKEKREWSAQRLQENLELREQQQEGMEKIQESGFLSQKSEGQVMQMLEKAGIPATKETTEKVMIALGMSNQALDMTDQSRAYIIGQNLEPTIDNLYQGKYSVYGEYHTTESTQQDFDAYREQIESILQKIGRIDEESMGKAQWLFKKELPINSQTLDKLDTLNQIQKTMTPDKVLEQIVFAMESGLSPKNAVLDENEFVVARDTVLDFMNIKDSTIVKVADYITDAHGVVAITKNNVENVIGQDEDISVTLQMLKEQQNNVTATDEQQVIPQIYNDGMSQRDIVAVTLKRQLEEIRQKLTVQSAVRMEQKGIHVETESLNHIVEELRDIENEYYSSQITDKEVEVTSEQKNLLQETLTKATDIANANAAILGTKVRQQQLLTMNELHAAIGSQTANRAEWNGVYETVSTEVRKDLGDSIQKAFSNIPDLLKEINVENTQANQRAVRILGYNSMDITKENIEQVKIFDQKVNQVIQNLKPSTVLELIREGKNPLDVPLDDLNKELQNINAKKETSSEEKYSRYLWQLEKSNQISPEERTGYIGVYRLLNQIEKTDGAVVGAVLESNQELTLGNLLTQARIRKGNGIDQKIDEEFGFTEVQNTKATITDQIEQGFAQKSLDNQNASSENNAGQKQKEYYQNLLNQSLEDMTPAKLEEMTDGDLEKLLDVSVERFFEQMKNLSGDSQLKKEYYDEQARQVRESLSNSEEAREYLDKMNIEDTVENIMTAKTVLEEGFSPYQEIYGKRRKLDDKQQKEFESAMDEIAENIDSEEALNEKCENAEKFMRDILTKSMEQADITFENLRSIHQLNQGLHFEQALRRSRSYDIPIKTGDGVTNLNLTIIHGTDESGKIQINMEDEKTGNISMEFRVSGQNVKGLILCDNRQGFEDLQSQEKNLRIQLDQAGYQVKNISYGMDFKSRNEQINEQIHTDKADTKALYQIAKILVRTVTSVQSIQ